VGPEPGEIPSTAAVDGRPAVGYPLSVDLNETEEITVSPVSRALTGEHLTFDLAEQVAELRQDETYVRTGRLGRTLVKEGELRLTMTVLAEGAEVDTHHAAAPMTLQVLEGRLQYRVAGEDVELAAGQFLFFGPGHAQDIRALEDTALLLTITGSDGEGDAATA
jgi:quercetin dioxygenase-like cupin family protein